MKSTVGKKVTKEKTEGKSFTANNYVSPPIGKGEFGPEELYSEDYLGVEFKYNDKKIKVNLKKLTPCELYSIVLANRDIFYESKKALTYMRTNDDVVPVTGSTQHRFPGSDDILESIELLSSPATVKDIWIYNKRLADLISEKISSKIKEAKITLPLEDLLFATAYPMELENGGKLSKKDIDKLIESGDITQCHALFGLEKSDPSLISRILRILRINNLLSDIFGYFPGLPIDRKSTNLFIIRDDKSSDYQESQQEVVGDVALYKKYGKLLAESLNIHGSGDLLAAFNDKDDFGFNGIVTGFTEEESLMLPSLNNVSYENLTRNAMSETPYEACVTRLNEYTKILFDLQPIFDVDNPLPDDSFKSEDFINSVKDMKEYYENFKTCVKYLEYYTNLLRNFFDNGSYAFLSVHLDKFIFRPDDKIGNILIRKFYIEIVNNYYWFITKPNFPYGGNMEFTLLDVSGYLFARDFFFDNGVKYNISLYHHRIDVTVGDSERKVEYTFDDIISGKVAEIDGDSENEIRVM